MSFLKMVKTELFSIYLFHLFRNIVVMYKIALIEPFMTGSHRLWAEGLKENLPYDIKIFSLPGFNWKWRMNGGAVLLAEMFIDSGFCPDLIVASDMIDLSLFISLIRKKRDIPVLLYFHENQLSYPWSPNDKEKLSGVDKSYGWINISSFLSADVVCFNSSYHKNSFTASAEKMLRQMPDCKITDLFKEAQKKAKVLYLGLELKNMVRKNIEKDKKLILWNHRWEYDKNPELFFSVLIELSEKGVDFNLALLGESYDSSPEIFKKAQKTLSKHIVKIGYCEDREEYIEWLNRASFLPVTSDQEFFGISVLEAVSCGVVPFLPKRLTYPELFSDSSFSDLFYRNKKDLLSKLEYALSNDIPTDLALELTNNAFRFDWSNIADAYVTLIDNIYNDFPRYKIP